MYRSEMDAKSESSVPEEDKPEVFEAINISRNGDGYLCLICNEQCKSIRSSTSHSTGRKHREMLDEINKSCYDIAGRVACKFCSSYPAADPNSFLIHFHVKNHFHDSNIRPLKADKNPQGSSVSYVVLEMNQTIEVDLGIYFCCCCGETLDGWFAVVDHIEEKKHKEFQETSKLKDYDGENSEHESGELVKSFVSHVTFSNYYCYLCDRLISGLKNCHQHIKGSVHTKNMGKKEDIRYQSLSEKVRINKDFVEKIVSAPEMKVTKEILNSFPNSCKSREWYLDSWGTYESNLESWYDADPYYSWGTFDNFSLDSWERIRGTESLLSKLHGPKLLRVSNELIPLISKYLLQHREKEIYCPACQAHITDSNNLVNHVVSRKHITEFSSYRAKIVQEHKNQADISKKNRSLSSVGRLNSEYKSSESISPKNTVSTAAQEIPADLFLLLESHLLEHLDNEIFCPACSVHLMHINNVLEHINGRNHKAKLENYKSKIIHKRTPKTENIKNVYLPTHRVNEKAAPQKSQNNVTTSKTIAAPKIQHAHLRHTPKKLNSLIATHLLRHCEHHIYCPACDFKIKGPTSLVNHTNSPGHADRLDLYRIETASKNVKSQKTPHFSGVEARGDLDLRKKTLKKVENPRRIASLSENITGLEKSVNQVTIAEVKRKTSTGGNMDETQQQAGMINSKKLPESESRTFETRPMKQERPKRQHNNRRKPCCFDPKYPRLDMQHIYEMNKEKTEMMRLSCQLCFPKTSTEIYCLICKRSVASESQNFHDHICSTMHTQYLAEAEQGDKHFSPYLEPFSDLSIAKEFMQQTSIEETIRCLACDKTMENDDVIIAKHIEQDSHKEGKQAWNTAMEKIFQEILANTESNWYNIQKYWCQLCNRQCNTEFEFAKHVDSKSHIKRLKKFSKGKNILVYDACVPCATLWLGFSDFYTRHYNKPVHVRDYSDCTLPGQVRALLENSEAEVNKLIELSDQVLTVQKVKADNLLKCLEDTVEPTFPDAKAYPFGSRVSGLGLPDNNIDVFLDCGTFYETKNTKDSQVRTIRSVEECLYTKKRVWRIEKIQRSIKTPTIRLHHKGTGLSCSVSFKNGLSVENTKLLKRFIDNYPLCRRLMLFLKKWLHSCNLSGFKFIINYALYWYIIFYLQSKSILPSVASLIVKENRSKIIDGWETGICKTFDKSLEEFTFSELLHGFFVFYTNFDYRYSVACPILGRAVSKLDFTELHLLPEEIAPYINQVTAEGPVEWFRIDSVMCIQDPFDLSHNLTQTVSKSTLNRFKVLCAASAEVLNNIEQH